MHWTQVRTAHLHNGSQEVDILPGFYDVICHSWKNIIKNNQMAKDLKIYKE